MTDNPDDPNAEAGQEQSAVVEEEVWQGNEPPVDDFADPAAGEAEVSVTQEEGEAPLEEGAEAETETEAAAGETAPKKRGLLIPAVVALVGAGALAGALYWQFGGSSNNPAPQMMAQAPLRTMPMTAPPPATTPAPVMPPSSASDMPPVSASTLTSSSPSGVATPLPSPPASVTTSVTITQAPASAPTSRPPPPLPFRPSLPRLPRPAPARRHGLSC